MRTSISHPLKIEEIEFGNGKLGITFCPGKKQSSGMTGPWDRDLSLDLDVIQEWNPDYLVACCEPHEYIELQVPEIFNESAKRGINIVPLAFPDDTVPNESLNEALKYWIPVFAACVQSGGRVLFFCKGGLGRSGFLFCRTMIELGFAPAKSINDLRRVRTGAVYTIEQMETILTEAWK